MNKNLFEYTLRLGDTSLILSQRLGEWCGHGPVLEEDIALTNIALDLLGQAKAFLAYAGEIEGKGRSEDSLAFHRDANQFRNTLLTEQPNVDFGCTIVRQLFVSAWQHYLYSELSQSIDKNISALAVKSLKEVSYHLRYASDWTLRLGDGTEESHQRMQNAVNELWNFTGDLFEIDQIDEELLKLGIAADMKKVEESWNKHIRQVLSDATLSVSEINNFMRTGSRKGIHTEHLGFILAEMQFLPRAYPDAKW
ncbi:MAG TPA: phenylacetate-CoA oxygenase subunit PaaC [Bacteroidia bacterium]|jgi:ring-1,2-phenylacetyl-CoA epoxidase subunit PaaC|nr:phenylacetate-CoA oxygenase subunit PaaC [Bacteroidia bacterium]HMU19723.1 phenylacetate-CoA oxygenase subunit PaaC [Bacteroidia bacterium]